MIGGSLFDKNNCSYNVVYFEYTFTHNKNTLLFHCSALSRLTPGFILNHTKNTFEQNAYIKVTKIYSISIHNTIYDNMIEASSAVQEKSQLKKTILVSKNPMETCVSATKCRVSKDHSYLDYFKYFIEPTSITLTQY